MGFFLPDSAVAELPRSEPRAPRRQAREVSEHERGCDACPLREIWPRISTPRMPVTGNPSGDILVMGEAPGEDEDLEGQVFVGKTGKFLRRYLPYRHLDRLAFTNAARCRPPGNRTPTGLEMHCCSIHLEEDVAANRYKAVLLVGGAPLSRFVPESSITQIHGIRFPVRVGAHTMWAFPVFHPSFVERTGGDRSAQFPCFRADLERFFREVDRWGPPRIEEIGPADVVCTRDEAEARAVIDRMEGVVGVDLETSCLKPYERDARVITGAVSDGKLTVAFPAEHPEDPNSWGLSLLLEVTQRRRWVGHQSQFEFTWLTHQARRLGTNWTSADFDDSMALVRQHHRRTGVLGLDLSTRLILGTNIKKLSPVDPRNIMSYTLDEVLFYNGLDAWGSARILHHLGGRVNAHLYQHFIRAARAFALMELEGLETDQEQALLLKEEWTAVARAAEAEAQQVYEVRTWIRERQQEFNIGNSDHVGTALAEYGRVQLPKTPSDKSFSTDDEVLGPIAEKNPLARATLKYREATKHLSTYIDAVIRTREKYPDGRIHPAYRNGMQHHCLRSCVAEGTKILVVRDFIEHPEGIPIEQIRKGDYVYCFDDQLQPAIRKVLWAGKTSHRKVVRLHWSSRSTVNPRGYLDVTPEHGIRLLSGEYHPAAGLHKADFRSEEEKKKKWQKVRVLSARRNKDQIYFTGSTASISEYRFIYEQFYGKLAPRELVHHKNHLHLDHHPSNLEKNTNIEHSRYHSNGRNNPRFVDLGKFSFLRTLAKAKGKLTKAPLDFTLIQRKAQLHSVDLVQLRYRYDQNGDYISLGRLHRLGPQISLSRVVKEFGFNYGKSRRLLHSRGIEFIDSGSGNNPYGRRGKSSYNHVITRVEWLDQEVDVYDIEVEDYHNFIANEICVHNSSEGDTNIQNWPKRKHKRIRSLIRARPGHVYLPCDSGQIQARIFAMASRDRALIQSFIDRSDIHTYWMNRAIAIYPPYLDRLREQTNNKGDDKKLMRDGRNVIKYDFVFASFFGQTARSCSEKTGIPLIKTDELLHEFWGGYPEAHKWLEARRREYRDTGGVHFLTGQQRYGVMPGNECIITAIQGGEAEFVIGAVGDLAEASVQEDDPYLLPRIVIHDDITLEVPDQDEKIEYYAKRVTDAMNKIRFDWQIVPLTTEVQIGYNWADLEEIMVVEGDYIR